jgi:hypothetical protein
MRQHQLNDLATTSASCFDNMDSPNMKREVRRLSQETEVSGSQNCLVPSSIRCTDARVENVKAIKYALVLAKACSLLPLQNVKAIGKGPDAVKFAFKSCAFFFTLLGAVFLTIVVPVQMNKAFPRNNIFNTSFENGTWSQSAAAGGKKDHVGPAKASGTLAELQNSFFMRLLNQLAIGQTATNYFLHILLVAPKLPAFITQLQLGLSR